MNTVDVLLIVETILLLVLCGVLLYFLFKGSGQLTFNDEVTVVVFPKEDEDYRLAELTMYSDDKRPTRTRDTDEYGYPMIRDRSDLQEYTKSTLRTKQRKPQRKSFFPWIKRKQPEPVHSTHPIISRVPSKYPITSTVHDSSPEFRELNMPVTNQIRYPQKHRSENQLRSIVSLNAVWNNGGTLDGL